jgi:[acyl-carrier-protein] S-malonyltransferase
VSLALLFPGQGTQHPAMLAWLDDQAAAQATLTQLAADIGPDWRRRLVDPAWTRDNARAQSLLTACSVAAWQCLAPLLPAAAVVAGYSVGEVAAFCAAGVYSPATALQLARVRAAAMSASVAGLATGLLAVQGLTAGAVAAACHEHGLALAIQLAADRVVLGGPEAALQAAETALGAAGGHCSRLAVGLASHTPWMAAAARAFADHLRSAAFTAPRCTLVCNLGGIALRLPADLQHALAAQIDHPVRWQACLDTVAERGVRCVLEVGPGTTLSRLWAERGSPVPARSIDEFRSPEAVARWVQATLAR